jgi:hypothetical protein
MSDIFTRRLLARQLGAAGLGMMAALAASDLASAKDPGKFGVNNYVNNTNKPLENPAKPPAAVVGSQKQAIKGFQRAQYVKAECAQLKAQMQNPGLSSGEKQSLISQILMLHCK